MGRSLSKERGVGPDREAVYDEIGDGYAAHRREDPRIAQAIWNALGDATSVGAGTGSYEPAGRRVVAVEPSSTMIAQRSPSDRPGGASRRGGPAIR